MKILILLTNDMSNDSRVKRVASVISLAGNEVTVLAARSEYLPDAELKSGYKIDRIIGPLCPKKKKKKKNILEKIPPFSLFFKLRKNIDKFKIKFKGFKIKLEKTEEYNYLDMFKIDEENDKKHIKKIEKENNAFFDYGLSYKPDIVYCNDLDTLMAGVHLKNKTGCGLIYDAHELYNEQFTNKSEKWKSYFYDMEKTLINSADEVFAVNKSIGEELKKRYNIKSYTVLANCVKYERVDTLRADTPRADTPRDGKKIKKILYHGRFEVNRGIEELIEAMKYVEGAELILRGDGLIKDELIKAIKKHGVKKKIKFKDMLPTEYVIKEAAKADIGVIAYIPSCLNNYLCSPNKLFEYIMAGLCVCASDLPELRRYIGENEIGEVFDPFKPKDIADKLNKILKDGELLNKYKSNARKAAEEKLNWEAESKKIVGALDKIGRQHV